MELTMRSTSTNNSIYFMANKQTNNNNMLRFQKNAIQFFMDERNGNFSPICALLNVLFFIATIIIISRNEKMYIVHMCKRTFS